MDGIDLLKQHWQKDQDFPKYRPDEIREMLHKSSSSLVKWIFIISLIELFIGICLNVSVYFYDTDVETTPGALRFFSELVDALLYFVTIYFIYCFFKAYKQIKNTNNTKVLLNNIILTRKTVADYIKFNIYVIIYSLALSGISRFLNTNISTWNYGQVILYLVFLSGLLFLVGWLLISLIKRYYKLLYIRLVNKLEVNYEDLQRLEDQE